MAAKMVWFLESHKTVTSEHLREVWLSTIQIHVYLLTLLYKSDLAESGLIDYSRSVITHDQQWAIQDATQNTAEHTLQFLSNCFNCYYIVFFSAVVCYEIVDDCLEGLWVYFSDFVNSLNHCRNGKNKIYSTDRIPFQLTTQRRHMCI